jgi:hypothetical protein
MAKKRYPTFFWHLKFIGGKLNGKVKRAPFAPTRWSHDGEEYRQITKREKNLEAEYIKCG